MRATSRVILSTLAVASLLSGCSIYRNKGRDQFEARAGGNVKTEIGVSRAPAHMDAQKDVQLNEDSESCWVQEAREALWSTPVGSSLVVQRLNESEISVCLSEFAKNGEEHHE
ncbi:MAG: hypothetical protein KF767_09150 [Bdellovibrionaceae bacterium]|nr:hypothetical protein [Pseudobdellovibrionaceae bacterium]